jgi:glycosyltransferase involved in cell wall biosynthesis
MKFLLVGDGPWSARFRARARSLGLQSHFVFTGLVAPEAVPGLLGVMDAVVHLSSREGLPRALPQAMAAARPVVAYDCDGAKEVCIDNQTGFLLSPGDRVGLGERLLRLAADPELRKRMGRRGRQWVSGRFDVQRMVDALYDLYTRLTRTKP